MDAYMVVLRLIHIFSGIIWVGSGIFMLVFVSPALQHLGPDAGKFMRSLLRNTRFRVTLPVVAVLTVLSGILMYVRTSNNFSGAWMSSGQGIVLSIGALAGILAAAHGGAIIGPITAKTAALLDQLAGQTGAPSQEQATELQTLQAKSAQHGYISVILMIITVIGMTTFRYV